MRKFGPPAALLPRGPVFAAVALLRNIGYGVRKVRQEKLKGGRRVNLGMEAKGHRRQNTRCDRPNLRAPRDDPHPPPGEFVGRPRAPDKILDEKIAGRMVGVKI